jgi:predicted ATP-grasp superfamily ATP-dependent carboligase
MPSRATLPAEPPALLVAAQSGRALAAAARRAGYVPLVADLFGDEDTLDLAADHRLVRGRFGLGLAEGDVIPALEALATGWHGEIRGLVLGSGFESAQKLMAALEGRFPVLGASAETVSRLKDPFAFASLLGELGVPHPEVAPMPTAGHGLWLSKRQGGSGGGHIRIAGQAACRGRYAQRALSGRPFAAAFLADGRSAEIIAFTEQWTAPSRHAPWRYGGAVGPVELPASIVRAIESAVRAIVAAVGLRGLASADVLIDGEDWRLLEINPRPGATLDLLDRGKTPLLSSHVAASEGHLLPVEDRPPGAAGSIILYVPRTIASVGPVPWPAYVADRPKVGTTIRAGQPVCTVTAAGCDPAEVRSLLERRAANVFGMLEHGHSIAKRLRRPSVRERSGEAAG